MYKIFEARHEQPCTLFHGIQGSRTLPLDEWVEADVKWVRDGTSNTYYWSGFHLIPTLEEAFEYLKRFRLLDTKVVAKVEVDHAAGTWDKAHSRSNITLAKRIRICVEDWKCRSSCG